MSKKLVLFDIDGTMIRSHGFWHEYFFAAFSETTGHVGEPPQVRFAGSTDYKICKEMMLEIGIDEKLIPSMSDEMLGKYLSYAERAIRTVKHPVEILPGVKDLVCRLNEDERFRIGLLTGNIELGAKMKLSSVGLSQYFFSFGMKSFGAFGSDSMDRNQYGFIAREKAKEVFNEEYEEGDAFLIGDTVFDVDCALHSNMKCIAVGTGKIDKDHSPIDTKDALLSRGAHFYFDDLSQTQKILEVLLS